MKLKDQVVSLELAKKLKKLGVKQGSYFKHFVLFDGTTCIERTLLCMSRGEYAACIS